MATPTGNENKSTPAWREVIDNLTMANGGTTKVTNYKMLNGIITTAIIDLPDSTNGVTATFTIEDENGYELYSSAGLADNTEHVLPGIDVVVAGKVTFGLQASGDPGADWTTTRIVMSGV